MAASLDHPNVIPIYEAGEQDGQLYLAMRFVEGSDLRSVLQRGGTLGLQRALASLAQVAGARGHHAGQAHILRVTGKPSPGVPRPAFHRGATVDRVWRYPRLPKASLHCYRRSGCCLLKPAAWGGRQTGGRRCFDATI